MTTWDPPIGAFLLPRQTEGEWWELGDVTRGNTSYYYSECSHLVAGFELTR